MGDTIPPHDDPDARIAWIIERAQMLDAVRGEDWLADEIETLWNNPREYEDDGLYDPPDEVSEAAYALFTMGLIFGTDYEYYFPSGRRDEWDLSAADGGESDGE